MRISLILSFLMMVSGMLFAADFKPEARIGGFVSAGYTRTDNDLDYPKGDFGLHQSELRLNVILSTDISLYVEPSLVPYGGDTIDLTLDETYVSLRMLKNFDIRLGRVDVPFSIFNGSKDANKNLLITRPVGVVLGVDEGVSVGTSYKNLDLTVALTNGARAYARDNADMVSGKVGLNFEKWGVGVGGLRSGKSYSTAITMGEAMMQNNAGLESVTALEANLRLSPWKRFDLLLAYNSVGINYVGSSKKDIDTWVVEGVVGMTRKLSLVGRYSVTDCNDGFTLGSGSYLNTYSYSYGNDVESLSRASVGLNYRCREFLTFKTEVGQDRFNTMTVADTRGTFGLVDAVVNF